MKLMYEAGLDQLIKHIKTALNGKEPTFNKNTGFNKNKTDTVENDTNKLFTAKGAYDLKSSVTTAYTNLINSTKTALETSIATKLSHGGYSGTAQSLKTDIDSKLPNPGYGGIHEFGRTIDLHLSGSTADYDTRISSNTDKTLLIQNSNGTLELGPKNATDCHIYTDRAKFYLNKDISISGKLVYHEGNKPTSDDVGAVAKTSISSSTTSTSTTTVASSAALKEAYDKAVEGLNRANSVKTELDSKKVDKTINVIAGAGLSGGGSLGNNVTVNLVSADNGILIRENDIKLNLVDDLTTGGVTRGLTAEQGKVLLQMIQALGTGGATKLLRAAEILSDNEYMGILASGGTSIMANTRLYNPILYIDGSRIDKGQYTVDLDFGRITLKEPYETIYPEGTVWVIEDQMPHHIDFCFPTMNMLKVSEEIKEKIKVGNVIKLLGESEPDDGGHYLVKCEQTAKLNAVDIGAGRFLNEIPNTRISQIRKDVDTKLSKSGDTMTGALVVEGNYVKNKGAFSEAFQNEDLDLGFRAYFGLGSSGQGYFGSRNTLSAPNAKDSYIVITPNGGLSFKSSAIAGLQAIYHGGNRPTPSEIGAMPSSGGTVNGTLQVRGILQAYNYATGARNSASFTIDKSGSGTYGIGTTSSDNQIKYGKCASHADGTWITSDINHFFDGTMNVTGTISAGNQIYGQRFNSPNNQGIMQKRTNGDDQWVLTLGTDNRIHLGWADQIPILLDSSTIIDRNGHHVVRTSKGAGYRIHSDGYKEAWGRVRLENDETARTITLPFTFSSDDWVVLDSPESDNASIDIVSNFWKSGRSAIRYWSNRVGTSGTGYACWYVCGY